jgi:hypothetical protein
MAPIRCPDCGIQAYDKASNCAGCGRPLASFPSIVLPTENSRSYAGEWLQDTVFPTQNSRSCAGEWPHNNRSWFCSREFTTLKGINRPRPEGTQDDTYSMDSLSLLPA